MDSAIYSSNNHRKIQRQQTEKRFERFRKGLGESPPRWGLRTKGWNVDHFSVLQLQNIGPAS